MLGVGGSEIIIIGLLFLLIFGPSKLPQMARDVGKFVGEARRSIDEFKDELTMEPDQDEKPARRRDSRKGKGSKKSAEIQDEADDAKPDDSGDEKSDEDSSESAESESSPRATSTQTDDPDEDKPKLRDL